jgi:hypothetical protein
MSDPKRWLDEGGGATFEERELLEAGREVKAPGPLRKRIWLGLAASASGIGVATDAAGAVLQKGAMANGALSIVSGTVAKGVIAVALVAGAGWAVTSFRSSPEVPPEVRAVRGSPGTNAAGVAPPGASVGGAAHLAAREPAAATSVQQTKPGPTSENRSIQRHAPAASGPREVVGALPASDAPESRATSRLREESAAVLAIRKTLLSGNAIEALRMLARARTEFPRGALAQEREALTVRGLVESGQKDAARQRGEAFLRTFPRSPHAAEVRALVGR